MYYRKGTDQHLTFLRNMREAHAMYPFTGKRDKELFDKALAESQSQKMWSPGARKNASSIWSMMTKIAPGLAKCNICNQEFRSDKGTSNMLRHVKTKHSKAASENAGESGAHPSGSSSSESQPIESEQPTIGSLLDTVTRYRPESDRKRALDQKLLRIIYRDMQPFSIVDDFGFQDFCREMDPGYELPSRWQLKQSLSTLYAQEKDQLMEILSDVESVAITIDSWTSFNTDGFLMVTAHFLSSWELQSVVLATRILYKDQQGNAEEAMAETINEVLEEFSIKEKLVSVTTDNAPVMIILVNKYLKVLHVKCFLHTLNLIVEDSIKASSEMRHMVGAVRAILNFFLKSAKATAKLRAAIEDLGMEQHKLCQDVDTRWNSTLKMLRRYRELHPAISGVLMALGKVELIIPDKRLEQMKTFLECLEPFEEATEMISTEKKTSLSKILVVVRQLQEFLKNETTRCQLTDSLISCLSDHFPNPEEDFSSATATLLDPRFKRMPFSNDYLRTRHEEEIVNMLNPFFSGSDSSTDEESVTIEIAAPYSAKKQKSFMQSFVDKVKQLEGATPQKLTGARAEFQMYMATKFLDMNEDPLQWWQEHSSLFPHLSVIARKYLFIPATSIHSERFFSRAEELVSKTRNCLSESTIDMVLFLNKLQK